MAEVTCLQDKSLLALEVSSFVRKYPDITSEQLAGLVQLREDVGRSEARQLAQEILDGQKFRYARFLLCIFFFFNKSFRPKTLTPFTKLFQPKKVEETTTAGRVGFSFCIF